MQKIPGEFWDRKLAGRPDAAFVQPGQVVAGSRTGSSEKRRAQFAIADRMLYRTMAELILNSARIVARIRQGGLKTEKSHHGLSPRMDQIS